MHSFLFSPPEPTCAVAWLAYYNVLRYLLITVIITSDYQICRTLLVEFTKCPAEAFYYVQLNVWQRSQNVQ